MNPRPMPAFGRTKQRPAKRMASVAGLVMLAHVGLLALVLSLHQRTLERPVELRSITTQLISISLKPPVKPATLQSTAPPQPHPQPHPVEPRAIEKTLPVPTQVSAVPAPPAPAEPAPATPAPAAPATPAISHETLAIDAPKDVTHLDCNIAKPDYPRLSKRRGESGTAVVRFVVGLAGNIEDVLLQKSSGYAGLDEAALGAMHASTCRPYLENGKALRAAYSQPFTFSLAD